MTDSAEKNPIYWSFSGPDSWRMSVPQTSTAFVADAELVQELEKRASPVRFETDSVLFREGDEPTAVYLVRKGTVTLSSRSEGDAVLRIRAGEGSLLGVPAVVGVKPYSLTAQADDGAEVSQLSSEEFVHLMHTEPMLAFRVLQVLAEEVRFAREALSHL